MTENQRSSAVVGADLEHALRGGHGSRHGAKQHEVLGEHVVVFAECAEAGSRKSRSDRVDTGSPIEANRRVLRHLLALSIIERQSSFLEFAQNARLQASGSIVERTTGATGELRQGAR